MATVPGNPPTYTTTDFQVLQVAQARLLEPVTATAPIVMTTTMWSVADLLGFLQYRISRFLRETGLVVARLGYDGVNQNYSLPASAGQEPVTLPQNLVDVLRLAWVGLAATNVLGATVPNSVQEIPREDFLSLDATQPDWESTQATTPIGYTRSITQQLQAFLANPPSDIGGIDLTFVAFSGPLTGLGVKLGIPPEFCMYPLYGMLADAYSVEGEAYNQSMASYFEGRFQEGVELATCLLCAPSVQDGEGG